MHFVRATSIVVACILLAACGSGTAPSGASPAPTLASVAQSAPPSGPVPTIYVAPTENYQEVLHFKVGQPVPLSKDGVTVSGKVSVLRVAQVAGFGDLGFPGNTPGSASDAFLAVQIKYEAIVGSLPYSAASWSLVNGNNHAFDYSDPPDGPKEKLLAGTLAEGTSVTAWVVYEVDPVGLALLSPLPPHTPVTAPPSFVIVLRDATDNLPTGTAVPAGANP